MRELQLRVLLLMSMLFTYGSACTYNKWGETLSCYGREVTEFPNITNGVSHIDMLNTSLTSLPDIETFPRLLSMTIEDNEFLDCQDVLDLKQTASHVVITTDCDDHDKNFCHVSGDCIKLCVDILSNHIV